jgi:hypothetical protein
MWEWPPGISHPWWNRYKFRITVKTMIHSLRRRLGLLVELMADIVEQGGLRDFRQRPCWVLRPPSGEVEQVKGIGAERAQ